jgi:formylglycine-generating enzyme required for sulfatase activity
MSSHFRAEAMSDTIHRPLNVFLCHASQDKPAVRKLYSQLKSQSWIAPWLDEVNLLPGMDWELEIFKAIREADAILICLSKESIAKEGYVQKEFKRAIGFAEEKPDGAIFIIPLRLDDCKPPVRFQQWQWLDYFQAGAQNKLFQSLYLRANSLKILPSAKPVSAPVNLNPVGRDFIPTPPATLQQSRAASPTYDFEPQMIHIPAGKFTMGSNDYDDEKPPHTVNLSDYYIGKYPVTNREYQAFVREAKYKAPQHWNGREFPQGKANHPVVYVSWNDAVAYCAWLSKKTGKNYRLPTEAEWEKAARGTDGRKYPWGNDAPNRDLLNFNENIGDTTDVDSYDDGVSPYGVYDMAGNVWEWVNDWYGETYYQKSPPKNPLGPSSGEKRVLRGGSWDDINDYARSAYRVNYSPDFISYYIGFRCARYLP